MVMDLFKLLDLLLLPLVLNFSVVEVTVFANLSLGVVITNRSLDVLEWRSI